MPSLWADMDCLANICVFLEVDTGSLANELGNANRLCSRQWHIHLERRYASVVSDPLRRKALLRYLIIAKRLEETNVYDQHALEEHLLSRAYRQQLVVV